MFWYICWELYAGETSPYNQNPFVLKVLSFFIIMTMYNLTFESIQPIEFRIKRSIKYSIGNDQIINNDFMLFFTLVLVSNCIFFLLCIRIDKINLSYFTVQFDIFVEIEFLGISDQILLHFSCYLNCLSCYTILILFDPHSTPLWLCDGVNCPYIKE